MRPQITEAELVERYKRIGLSIETIKRIVAALKAAANNNS